MLRVKVELVPYGEEAGAHVIEEATIANDGTQFGNVGSYDLSEDNLAEQFPEVERDTPAYLGRIENLIRVPHAHRVTMARTALERIERRRYQENGGFVTDDVPQFDAAGHITNSDGENSSELGTVGHGV